jgi:flagellar motor switch protein FliM
MTEVLSQDEIDQLLTRDQRRVIRIPMTFVR